MPIIEDKGLILKKTFYQDTKLIVTIFTYHHGLISAGVTVSKKQLFKFGCLEIGHLVDLELLKLSHSYKLKDVSLNAYPKTLRDSLVNMETVLQLCQKLSFLLPEGLTHPIFFTFMTNAFKAFDSASCKKNWARFIFLKWLQLEGLLHVSTSPHFIQKEISYFLSIKKFEHLKPLSEEASRFIDSQLAAHF